MYRDTLFVNTLSRRGHNFAQIFATDFDWSCLFPKNLKSQADEELSFLFQQVGVPSAVICDNAKKMIQGEFNR